MFNEKPALFHILVVLCDVHSDWALTDTYIMERNISFNSFL